MFTNKGGKAMLCLGAIFGNLGVTKFGNFSFVPGNIYQIWHELQLLFAVSIVHDQELPVLAAFSKCFWQLPVGVS